jgi:subtilisin family serine protease
MMADTQPLKNEIPPVEAPVQFDRTQFTPLLVEVDLFLRVSQARESFAVNGTGLTAAVLDTGLRTTHVDFAGRVPAQRNFTADNGGNQEDASDGNGHGTNVGGIIVANGTHRGIAPGANIIPLKVLSNNGGGSFASVDKALDWVIQNRNRLFRGHGASPAVHQAGARAWAQPAGDPAARRSAERALRRGARDPGRAAGGCRPTHARSRVVSQDAQGGARTV